MPKFKVLIFLRRTMLWLNFFAILFNATLFVYATDYVIKSSQSYQFLESLHHIPDSPQAIFWESMISFSVLAAVMAFHHHYVKDNAKLSNTTVFIEFTLAILVFLSLRLTYNGIFLLVFVDFIISNRNQYDFRDYLIWIVVVAFLLFLLVITDYSILSHFMTLPDLTIYLNFLPISIGPKLLVLKNFMTILNLSLFVLILIYFAIYQLNQENDIQNKLALASKANYELKNYAALSEYIAKDRERKRIARDIHDSVGHALTGIAAGIDATLVLIDINKDEAKNQLEKIQIAVKQGIKDVRKALNRIRPGALNNYTLKESLKKMLKEYADISRIKIDFSYHWGSADFEKTTEDVVFRIIEESITNSLRHGHASQVSIACTKPNQNTYQMVIKDNGLGAKEIIPGYGITQMKERVAIINGKISFDGQNGFKIVVDIPVEDDSYD
ncbi:sensor histidine kinase [Lactobacillus sp. M0403]|uniref:sensor histidine kinase n=1 Tax=Lactobacillus sp. M0403 TaxID=2751031 RepID=UPI001E571640|nr:sensor histidine kinase [Lactobacillus sp. M0403]